MSQPAIAGPSAAPEQPAVAGRTAPPIGIRRWSRRVALDIVAALDVSMVLLGGHAGALAVGAGGLIDFAGDGVVALQLCLLTAAIAHIALQRAGHYQLERVDDIPVQPLRMLFALALAFTLVVSVAFTLGVGDEFPSGWIAAWFAMSLLLLSIERLAVRSFLKSCSAEGIFDVNLAVFGAGRIAMKLADQLLREQGSTRLVGVYDDRRNPLRLETPGLSVAGGLDELIEAGRKGLVDEIVVALPQSADRRIEQLVRKLEQLPVRIRVCTHVASDFLDVDPTRHRVSHIGPVGLLDIKSKPLADWGPLLKTVLDFALGGLLLVLLAPVFAVIALLIRREDGGPVLFRQKRHGLNHRVIEVVKFRTMSVMEDGGSVRQATRGDPRVTRIGAFLRRTSLDELPQLVNVLKGEMSLVGPRPHALVHNEFYGEMLERYANRHQVKPGITGWAQVNGFRGETTTPEAMQKRVEHDLHYIDTWSIWLDLRILAATPLYGVTHKNAY